MDRDSFATIVSEALDSLPEEFARHLENVEVQVEWRPGREHRRAAGLKPWQTLYGLYEGVPLDEWGGDFVPVPTRIVLFRLPLEEDFPDPDELADEVRITILHELAHHLGIEDEDRLLELGID